MCSITVIIQLQPWDTGKDSLKRRFTSEMPEATSVMAIASNQAAPSQPTNLTPPAAFIFCFPHKQSIVSTPWHTPPETLGVPQGVFPSTHLTAHSIYFEKFTHSGNRQHIALAGSISCITNCKLNVSKRVIRALYASYFVT
ncbi:hypothetical protein AB6A40_011199 [Gnathostoma spinigerum]|uniref:Uncharacterized protein n=1 Tax=Gnathostoma spinigerum TaxID=75299 RepID=A0ABD6EYG1_9BILA